MPSLDGQLGDAARARASHLTAARELQQFDMGVERIDIRSWPAYACDGVRVGIVDRLLVETSSGKIRYASVALIAEQDSGRRRNGAGSVLVPIGLIHVNAASDEIVINFLTSADLSSAPRLHPRPITRADEDETLASYGLATSRDVGDGFLYHSPHFDERRVHRVVP